MRSQPRTNPEIDRCQDLIHQLGGALITALNIDANLDTVTLTGRAASWYAKQLATSAARRMYPGLRIDNQLQVVLPR